MSAVAGSVAGTVLLVIGAFHVWWVRSPWPCATRQDLARNVVGRPEGDLPPIFAPLSILVGALLAAAAHRIPPMLVGFGWRDGRVARGRFAHRALPPAAVQAPRGLGLDGAWRAVRRFRELSASVPARYRDLDVRVYSPLCLALATLIVVVIVSAN